jgi:pyrimidine-nucleoside phosphorylase
MAQSADVVPADRLLYALRDVTATVDSLPLIASSIMCKKLATGADAIVLDVKTGGGAFMRETAQALDLARAMVAIGRGAGCRVAALVTDMDGPLGHAIGNALEVREALETLHGRGPRDLTELCLILAGHLLALGDRATKPEQGMEVARRALEDGAALHTMQRFIAAQGGPERLGADYLPVAPLTVDVAAPRGGIVQRVDALALGTLARDMGAGRATKTDVIDPAAGLVVRRKAGAAVRAGEALATLHLARPDGREDLAARCAAAFTIGGTPPPARPLVHAVV